MSDWWDIAPTKLHCYHPYAERYLIDHWVEKCRHCRALRFVEPPGGEPSSKLWMPVTRALPLEPAYID